MDVEESELASATSFVSLRKSDDMIATGRLQQQAAPQKSKYYDTNRCMMSHMI